MKLMVYQFKVLYSPVKWLLTGAFIVFIPFMFYAPTAVDVLNLYEIYLPFAGIILLPDLFWVDHYAQATEVLATRRGRRLNLLVYRLVAMVLLVIFMLLAGWLLLRMNMSPHGLLFSNEQLPFLRLLYVALPGLLFSGALSLLGGAALRSPEIGYLLGLANWMFWNINMENASWLNLFSYANRLSDLPSKWTLGSLSIVFVLLCGFFMLRPVEQYKLASRLKDGLMRGNAKQ
ncbi:hypothetical protein [Paenibacillus lentus]|uniref:Uncharacterized protein n=1 Tax=Paenibacillus lentus TaxID=1338368 RepID=A0A3Q8SB58_9BACL|nr:hypothetical protein [Paenibacillus lentus]AZK46663.1 hypothetical protein EIM92_11275 [Paenibacillus lentus]